MNTRPCRIEWRLNAGRPLEAFGRRVTPLTRALIVRGRTVFIWNRPYALQVQQDDRSELLPVTDLTLRLQLLALGAGLALACLLAGTLRRRAGR